METIKKGKPPAERKVRLKCNQCGWEGRATLGEAERTTFDQREQQTGHVCKCPTPGCGADVWHWK